MAGREAPYIELRTDAFTQSTPEMVDVVAALGYMYPDLARECPQTEELEALAAELTGMEAALLVPSGTMANLLGLLTQAPPGSEVIVEAEAHILKRERGGISAIAGLVPQPVPGRRGVLSPEDVAPVLREQTEQRAVVPRWQWSVLIARTALVAIENPHNEAGNTVWTVEQTRAICDAAHAAGAAVHIDGARIFNAAVALDVPVRELTAPADTVAIGIAKGLAAPVGALFCGRRETVERARVFRQMLGGAMHRPAWLSAAGLVALKKMPERFREDHRNARLLAEGIAGVPGIRVDLDQVQTNTVLFEITDPAWTSERLVARLAAESVRIGARGDRRCRMMTHHAIAERWQSPSSASGGFSDDHGAPAAGAADARPALSICSVIGLEDREPELLGDVGPRQADRHPDADLVGGAVDQVRHDPHPLLQVDRGDDVGRDVLEGLRRAMGDRVRVDRALAGRRPPFQVAFAGIDADGAGVELILPGDGAVLQQQDALPGGIPERLAEAHRNRDGTLPGQRI